MRKISKNKKGISSIVVIAILLVAVVAVAGAYVVLKDKNDDPDKDNSEVTAGKLGIGSKFYYESDPAFSSEITTAAASKTMIVSEVIGENAEYYFLKITTDDSNQFDFGILKMHKIDGSIGQAEKIDGKWAIKVNIQPTVTIAYLLTVTEYVSYGPLISSMELTLESDGAQTLKVNINTQKNMLKEPAEYVASEYFEKYCNYSFEMEMIIGPVGSTATTLATATMEMKVSGSASDSMVIESKTDMTIRMSDDGIKGYEEVKLSYSQIYISDVIFEMPNATYGEKVILDYLDEKRTVYEVTFSYLMGEHSYETKAYVDVDKPVMYKADANMRTTGITVTLSIILTDSNI